MKLKHCYEQSKRKDKPKRDLNGNDKVKGKWPPNWGRTQGVGEKENVVTYNKFKAVEKGHGLQHGEQKIRGMIVDRCSGGYVEKVIARMIFHCIKVE